MKLRNESFTIVASILDAGKALLIGSQENKHNDPRECRIGRPLVVGARKDCATRHSPDEAVRGSSSRIVELCIVWLFTAGTTCCVLYTVYGALYVLFWCICNTLVQYTKLTVSLH